MNWNRLGEPARIIGERRASGGEPARDDMDPVGDLVAVEPARASAAAGRPAPARAASRACSRTKPLSAPSAAIAAKSGDDRRRAPGSTKLEKKVAKGAFEPAARRRQQQGHRRAGKQIDEAGDQRSDHGRARDVALGILDPVAGRHRAFEAQHGEQGQGRGRADRRPRLIGTESWAPRPPPRRRRGATARPGSRRRAAPA